MNTSSFDSHPKLPMADVNAAGWQLPIIANPNVEPLGAIREPVIESAIDKINRLLQSNGHDGVFTIKGADRLGTRKCWQQSS